jgi:hypothetical protein
MEVKNLPLMKELEETVDNMFVKISAVMYMIDSYEDSKPWYQPTIFNLLQTWNDFKKHILQVEEDSSNIKDFVRRCLYFLRLEKAIKFDGDKSHWIDSIFGKSKCNCLCSTMFVCACLHISKIYKLGNDGLHACAISGHIYLKWDDDTGVETTHYSQTQETSKDIPYHKCVFTVKKYDYCPIVTNTNDILLIYLYNVKPKSKLGITLRETASQTLYKKSTHSLFIKLYLMIILQAGLPNMEQYLKLLDLLEGIIVQPSAFFAWINLIVFTVGLMWSDISEWYDKEYISEENINTIHERILQLFTPFVASDINYPFVETNTITQFINFKFIMGGIKKCITIGRPLKEKYIMNDDTISEKSSYVSGNFNHLENVNQ